MITAHICATSLSRTFEYCLHPVTIVLHGRLGTVFACPLTPSWTWQVPNAMVEIKAVGNVAGTPRITASGWSVCRESCLMTRWSQPWAGTTVNIIAGSTSHASQRSVRYMIHIFKVYNRPFLSESVKWNIHFDVASSPVMRFEQSSSVFSQ